MKTYTASAFGATILLLFAVPCAAQESSLNARIGANIGALVIQNNSLAVEIEGLQGQITDLQRKLVDQQALQTKLSESDARVRALEAQLAAQPPQTEAPK
jgi:hypothetical protein